MQNRSSAMAFLFVLLVTCVGGCVALSALTSGRQSLAVAVESLTPTGATDPTPADVELAPTNPPEEASSPQSELSTPVAPTSTPVPPATPTRQASPTPEVPPTSIPTRTGPGPAPPSTPYQYRVLRNDGDCIAGGVIGGWVYDVAGNGLSWANLQLYNDYGWSGAKQSEGPPQAGKYEFTMGFDAGLFHLRIVDDAGQPLSPVVDVDYQPNCSQRVDWERVQ